MLLTKLLIACSLFLAAEEEELVVLPTEWPVGTAYHIEFTNTKTEFEGDKETKRNSVRTPIDVVMVAKREDGYTVRWTYGKPVMLTPADSPIAERMTSLVEGMQWDMLTDVSGSIERAADPMAMTRHLEQAAKLLIEEIEAKKALSEDDLATLKRSLAATKGLNVQASQLAHPKAFYMLAGAQLVPGEKREYEDLLPNPLGGDPLPSQAYFFLRKVDAAANEAVVEWRQRIDPEKAAPLIEASIRALMRQSGKEIDKDIKLSLDAIDGAATYVYDLKTGIPKSVVVSRTTTMAGKRSITSQEFVVSRARTQK